MPCDLIGSLRSIAAGIHVLVPGELPSQGISLWCHEQNRGPAGLGRALKSQVSLPRTKWWAGCPQPRHLLDGAKPSTFSMYGKHPHYTTQNHVLLSWGTHSGSHDLSMSEWRQQTARTFFSHFTKIDAVNRSLKYSKLSDPINVSNPPDKCGFALVYFFFSFSSNTSMGCLCFSANLFKKQE